MEQLSCLGSAGSDPRLAWQSYYDRLGEAKLDLLLIEPLRTHWTARDFAPDTFSGWSPSSSTMPRAWLTFPSCGTSGGLGSPRVEDGEIHPWCPSQLTWLRGEHHGQSSSVAMGLARCHGGWGGTLAALQGCGLPTPELCEQCFSSVCSTCPPSQCPGCHPVLRRDPSAAAAA